MQLSSLWKRVLLFFIAVPIILSIIIFLPYLNHLVFNILVASVTVLSLFETARFFEKRNKPAGPLLLTIIGFSFPAVNFMVVIDVLPPFAPLIVFLFFSILIFGKEVFRLTENTIHTVLERISGGIFLLVYPTIFLSYTVLMTGLPDASFYIVFFYVMVSMNDVAAYIFGKLFGRWSRKPLPVSPQKSLIGFYAGFLTSIGIALAGWFLFQDLIPCSLLQVTVLGAAIGVTTILGDLIESALKRSARVKDSGSAIPGRGGLLDSIDSVLFSAPVFFYAIRAMLESG